MRLIAVTGLIAPAPCYPYIAPVEYIKDPA